MCGIIGLYHPTENVSGEIYDALIQVQHRGQDAAGIATWDNKKLFLHKELGVVTEVFKTNESLSLDGNIGICLLYTSPSPRDMPRSRMPSSA